MCIFQKGEKELEERRRGEEAEAHAKHVLSQETTRRKMIGVASAAAKEAQRRSQHFSQSPALLY